MSTPAVRRRSAWGAPLAVLATAQLISGCASPSPAPLASETVSPAPSEELTAAPDVIVGAFLALVGDSERTFHMDWSGTHVSGAGSSEFAGSVDFNGPDVALRLTIGLDGGDHAVSEYTYVAGHAYSRFTPVRAAPDGWQSDAEPAWALDPFGLVRARDVLLVGPHTTDATALYHIRVLNPEILGSMLGGIGSPTSGDEVQIDRARSSYDIFLDGAGTPVRATAVQATAARQGEPGFSWTRSEFAFASWNAPITIAAPR